jgi:hypothetical protein
MPQAGGWALLPTLKANWKYSVGNLLLNGIQMEFNSIQFK